MVQTINNYQGPGHFHWLDIVIAAGVAVGINMLIFLFIPFLSEVSLEKKASEHIETFKIQTRDLRERVRPMQEKQEPPEPKEMPRIPPPEAIATGSLHPSPATADGI
ncbi:MAG: hypothetical protein AVO38_13035 [delta proteobacterium ML8_D]|nr:MAG: hypothetical protein AVO38_13035 [delta proteobacterium ML8_D]